jgi:2-phosphosulfolactate phosphatase
MKNIAVCLSPEMIHLFDLKDKAVVVVDILRATSSMVTGLGHGLSAIKPVASLDECRELGKNGYITAAERGGEKVEGFDIGNSPFSYMAEELKGRKVGITTTNGTLAISKSLEADHILIGAFLNINAVADRLRTLDKDVVIHCAGWKGSVNLEDTLFAGALIEILGDQFELTTDDAVMAQSLYRAHKNNLLETVANSAHAKRLAKFGVIKDIEFCVKFDEFAIVPYLADGELIK